MHLDSSLKSNLVWFGQPSCLAGLHFAKRADFILKSALSLRYEGKHGAMGGAREERKMLKSASCIQCVNLHTCVSAHVTALRLHKMHIPI